MHHPNPLDPNVSAQYDDPSHEACPRAFEHAPANGTSDQSGVNAQSYQESMPQTQTEPSKTKKRQRSKAGGSNGETPKKRKTATRSETVDWVATAYVNSYQSMTAEAAEERLTMRIPMDFAEKDDLEAVVDNKEHWIRRLMSAFDKQYSAMPVVEDFGDLIYCFKPWQDDHYEAAVTCVYSKIISSHKFGSLDQHGPSFHYDPTLVCSKRLTGCIEAIEKITLVREDVIKHVRVEEFVSNPAAMMKRKEECKILNERKKIELEEQEKLKKQIRESTKKWEELDRKSKGQDDSSESKGENEGFAGSEVSMIGPVED
jgi:hypothetical protein